jgi:ribosomal RNA-processing protein 12
MKAEDSSSHAKCCLASFQVAKQVVTSTDQWVYDGALVCLVELILQLETKLEIVEKTVKALISCRDRAGAMPASAVALEDAIYRVVEGLGIEEFWALVDFPQLYVENTTSNYSWLVKVMRLAGSSMATGCASLAFFHNEVIPLTREFDVNIGLSNGHRQNFVELWSLLPCFCDKPTDITVSLPKIAPILVRAMKDKRYPQLLVSPECEVATSSALPASHEILHHRFPFRPPWTY